jgi:hypothetical protein
MLVSFNLPIVIFEFDSMVAAQWFSPERIPPYISKGILI